MKPGRILDPGHYGYDDVHEGDRIETGSVAIAETLIDQFAALSGDRFEIHISGEAARAHGFDNRVAHGLLILSLVDGLKNQAQAQFKSRASLGWDWSFRTPVLAGDAIRATLTLLAKRETRNRDLGILTLGFDVLNQRGELVQSGTNQLMVYR